jgi:hypothetical protein
LSEVLGGEAGALTFQLNGQRGAAGAADTRAVGDVAGTPWVEISGGSAARPTTTSPSPPASPPDSVWRTGPTELFRMDPRGLVAQGVAPLTVMYYSTDRQWDSYWELYHKWTVSVILKDVTKRRPVSGAFVGESIEVDRGRGGGAFRTDLSG